MPDVRLHNPRLAVTFDDGEVVEIQTTNADLVRWDRTAAKHGWPGFQSAPFLWTTFLAWSALRRTGEIPDALTWEQFSDVRVVSVRNLADEANGTDDGLGVVDPTLPGVAPG